MEDQRRTDVGISISQSGSPVDLAPDYKKVLDSRWRFMEVEHELDFPVSFPAVAADTNGIGIRSNRVNVMRHGLPFTPAIEASTLNEPSQNVTAKYDLYTFADDEYIYIEGQYFATLGAAAISDVVSIRVYNLPILEEYSAKKELVAGSSSEQGDVGVKVLDGSDNSVQVGQDYPVGFSVDTTKKILSVHKHGVQDINRTFYSTLRMGSVDVNADTMTYTVLEGDTSWLQTVGEEVRFFAVTGQGGAMPGGLTEGQSYYIIPMSSNSFRFATSKANAEAGVYVNITSTGSAPVNINWNKTISNDEIVHDIGYPPTYLLARVEEYAGKRRVHPFKETLYIVFANNRTIRIRGIQAMATGEYAYVILKDPAEVIG